MSKIEVGRWSQQLRRMLGQKGQESIAAELSPEVSPTIQLEGEAAEWRFLKSVRDVASGAQLAGAVGFFSRFRLRNPPGPGVLGQVNFCEAVPRAATDMVIARGTETTDLALSTVGSTVLDQRWQAGAAAQGATLIFSVTNLDAVIPEGRVFFRTARNARISMTLPVQVVLPPGTSLDWGGTVANVEIFANIAWHERSIPRLEL